MIKKTLLIFVILHIVLDSKIMLSLSKKKTYKLIEEKHLIDAGVHEITSNKCHHRVQHITDDNEEDN